MVIDRFEGSFAICEANNEIITIERNLLPDGCQEGSVIYLEDNVYKLEDSTSERERLKRKMHSLFHK